MESSPVPPPEPPRITYRRILPRDRRPNAFVRFLASPRFREGATFVTAFLMIVLAAFNLHFPDVTGKHQSFVTDVLLEVFAAGLSIPLLLRRLSLSKAGWTVLAGFVLFTAYALGVAMYTLSLGRNALSSLTVMRVVVPPMVLLLGIDAGLLSRRGLVRAMAAASLLLFVLQDAYWVQKGAAAIKTTILGSSVNYYLACSSLLLFASLYILLHPSLGRFWRAISYANCALFSFIVLIAGSRTSFAVAGTVAVFFAVVLAASRRRGLFVGLLLCAAAGSAAAAFLYWRDFAGARDTMDRLLSLFHLVPTPDSVEGSDFVRWEIWEKALLYLQKTRGFLGGGQFLLYVNGAWMPAHNFLFEMLLTVGIPGLFIFLTTIATALVHTIRNAKGWHNVAVLLLPTMIFLGYGFFHPFVTTGVLVNIAYWIWMGIGLRNNVWKWEKVPRRKRRRARRSAP